MAGARKTKRKRLLVGITGAIGAGKSTVARVFRDAGYPVISADDLARQITAPGSPALQEIRALFGARAINADGAMDRAFVRREILRDSSLRKKLEALTHPRIQDLSRRAAEESFHTGARIVFYEAPLLFEAKSDAAMDAVICVSAPEELLIERAMKRDGVGREQAEKMLAAQMPQDEKCQRSTYVLKNEGSEAELKAAASALLAKLEKSLG